MDQASPHVDVLADEAGRAGGAMQELDVTAPQYKKTKGRRRYRFKS